MVALLQRAFVAAASAFSVSHRTWTWTLACDKLQHLVMDRVLHWVLDQPEGAAFHWTDCLTAAINFYLSVSRGSFFFNLKGHLPVYNAAPSNCLLDQSHLPLTTFAAKVGFRVKVSQHLQATRAVWSSKMSVQFGKLTHYAPGKQEQNCKFQD